jgi:hypothetical protein
MISTSMISIIGIVANEFLLTFFTLVTLLIL